MQDNVAGEGLLAMEAGEWHAGQVGDLVAGINWTVDAYTCWGVWLTLLWRRFTSGRHRFQVSPSGRWIHIMTSSDSNRGLHWIYRPPAGSKIVAPDRSVVATVDDTLMMRISFSKFLDPTSPVTFQYFVRRVAHMEEPSGGVVLDQANYEALTSAAVPAGALMQCCMDQKEQHIGLHQAVRHTPWSAAPASGSGVSQSV